MKTAAVVFGTRPDAIKMAPVVKALGESSLWAVQVVVTGQHREMLHQVLDLFSITPDIDLDVMRHQQSLASLTNAVLGGLTEAYSELRPDLVLVHGDTTTAFAGALGAFYQKIPVGHVEAGLRSGTYDNPFPEEANRRLCGVLSRLHFAPTDTARDHLIQEGVSPKRIWVTGNTVIDALLSVVSDSFQFTSPALQALSFERPIVLVTAHRRENWGPPLASICRAIQDIVKRLDVDVVFAMHKNPALQAVVQEHLAGQERVCLVDAPGYAEFANLMHRCRLLLTDSGGLQEEAPALGKPVLVLRETTERPEGLAAGTVRLVGADRKTIVDAVTELICDSGAYTKMAQAANPYGDGTAAQRIRAVLDEIIDTPGIWREHDGD